MNSSLNESDKSFLEKILLFADDTNIFVSGPSEQEVYKKANAILDKLHDYMYVNQLHINLTKSVYIHFRPHFNHSERETWELLDL